MTKFLTLSTLVPCIVMNGVQAQDIWKRTYGGFGSDKASAVRSLPDGGAVICGSTGSFGPGGGDVYVVRVDVQGEIVWSRALGGEGVEVGSDVQVLDNGEIIIAGATNSFGAGGYDGYAVLLDANGNTLWERTYGSVGWEFLHAVYLHDDGFWFAGQTYDTDDGSANMWVIRSNTDGEILWERDLGAGGQDEARGIVDLGPEGCLVSGTFDLNGPSSNAVIVKLDLDGNEEWSTIIDTETSDVSNAVEYTMDGGGILAGHSRVDDGPLRLFMAKVDGSGDLLWAQSISDPAFNWEARDMIERADGSFALAAYTDQYGAGGRDFSLLFVDMNGAFISGPTYGGPEDEEAWMVDLSTDGSYYIVGSTLSYGPGIEAMFVVRSIGDTLNSPVITTFDPVSIGEPASREADRIYPNPWKRGTPLNIQGLFALPAQYFFRDLFGRIVDSGGLVHPIFTPSAPTCGVYFLEVHQANGHQSRFKVLVQ